MPTGKHTLAEGVFDFCVTNRPVGACEKRRAYTEISSIDWKPSLKGAHEKSLLSLTSSDTVRGDKP